jgi:hypothetical protein
MHVMCFGENEVTTSSTPADVGSFGAFMSGIDSGGKSVVLTGPSGSRKIKRPPSRRSLDHNIALADVDDSDSLRGAKSSSSLGMSAVPASALKREGDSDEDGENRRLSMLSSKSTPPALSSRGGPGKLNTKRAKEASSATAVPQKGSTEMQQNPQSVRKVPVRPLLRARGSKQRRSAAVCCVRAPPLPFGL